MKKRFFYLLVVIGMTIFFVACEKTDKPEIESIEIGSSQIEGKGIATIKITIEAFKPSEGISSNELASVEYKGGGLQLNFPAILPNEFLGEYFWYNSANTIPQGVTISDPQVRVGNIWVVAHNDEGNRIGSFKFSNFAVSLYDMWYTDYIYADRDFTITGTSIHGLVFDCSFKKGWNIRYYSPTKNNYHGQFTTQKPLVKFEWRYEVFGID